jgi:isopentenyl-diphosphate Delta-isomerase
MSADTTVENVILVDADDRETGQAEKLAAHRGNARHRAISVCVFDRGNRMLLQRRATQKYHSGGLWTNTCCTHPRPGEPVVEAARRRLFEEMGVDCPLAFHLRTQYQARVGPDLFENEVVHMFVGRYDGAARPDPAEVAEIAWRTRADIERDIATTPDAFTYWFKFYIRAHGDALFDGAAVALRAGV